MYVANLLCKDRLTGRKVWAVREIPGGEYGDKWLSSFVIIRSHWFGKAAELQLAESINNTRQYKLMQIALKDLGFTSAWAMRNGRIKRYKL